MASSMFSTSEGGKNPSPFKQSSADVKPTWAHVL